MSPPKQFLEWTFHHRLSKMHIAWGIGDLFLQMIVALGLIPPIALLGWVIPRPPETVIMIGVSCFALLLVILIIVCITHLALYGPPTRTLRVDRQMITLTNTTLWRAKERRMDANGAKFYAVHFDFFERLFTFDTFRIDSAYHIEIIRSDETFLFPCVDEQEQSRIIQQIKEFLA